MAKWADYLISGVWKDSNGVITNLNVHVDTQTGINHGSKWSEASVIAKIKQGFSFYTIVWNYNQGSWNQGAKVIIANGAWGNEYLKTVKDGTVTDNLDNLIRMDWL